MKQLVGFFMIVLTFPILFIVQKAIADEWKTADSFHTQMSESIELSPPPITVPVVLKDRNGLLFAEEYVEWRDPLPLDAIPLFAQQLFLESEDQGFFEHRGYDVAAIVRAFAVNAASDETKQGASTITQQVVRMRFLSTEKTYERKLTELFYAAELEKQSTKDEILEMYLNEMFFGNQVYGLGAAATYYFSKPLGELTEGEMAFLAAIPNNPSLYDPLRHFDNTKKRQERLLDVLANNGVITSEDAADYKNEKIVLHVKKKQNAFPVYSTYVMSELSELIARSEGLSKQLAAAKDENEKMAIRTTISNRTREVLAAGVVIETALDPSKQRRDEGRVSAQLYPAGLQAGAAVIENGTREIVSLYGGKDYRKADFNRAYQAVRQPGSAIKPLLVYAPLFESGPYSENTPVNSDNICIGSYCPTNIGGYVYGTVTVKEAFRHSHNTAAIRLLRMVGIQDAFDYMKPFGFKSVVEQDMNYPAALGGFSKGMTPLEMASAYTSFIDGMYKTPHAIRSVKSRDGDVLYQWDEKKIEVWSPSTVNAMRRLLQDVILNGTGRGVAHSTSYTGGKTGTTDQYKDLWMAGLNDRYTTAVWVGYDRQTPMKRLSDQKIHLRLFSTLLMD
ncbi:penicillin-binding protein [Bacillus sp. OxB-1]|uniref:transglycosylase domain-containing protein n=1 Tax=Bacillus sp. (strain OxB-1) TaxID=98228 RepID=UPI000581CC44|nr:transglycosylase domain-containing protein [Bacillus sp. OxB-1]BAQ08505.1 penicillin-binding protein [Bacillus sp. OxB-1]